MNYGSLIEANRCDEGLIEAYQGDVCLKMCSCKTKYLVEIGQVSLRSVLVSRLDVGRYIKPLDR